MSSSPAEHSRSSGASDWSEPGASPGPLPFGPLPLNRTCVFASMIGAL